MGDVTGESTFTKDALPSPRRRHLHIAKTQEAGQELYRRRRKERERERENFIDNQVDLRSVSTTPFQGDSAR